MTEVEIDYTNWKGERRKRIVLPINVHFGDHSPYHPEAQWFLDAIDVEQQARRTFAIKDIHSWRPV